MKGLQEGLSFTISKVVKSIYLDKICSANQNFSTYKILSEIIKYFQTSEFHSRKLINKFKYTIFDKASQVIHEICRKEIKINLIDEYTKLISTKMNYMKAKDIKDYINYNIDYTKENYERLYNYLLEELKKDKIFVDINEEKLIYIIIYYLKDKSKISNSLVSLYEENVKITFIY